MNPDVRTWREMLLAEMQAFGETLGDIESCTLTEAELDAQFDAGYGMTQGKPFTLWTKSRVYFPTQYDGAEGVSSVSRNPDGRATVHVGQ
jgi:hypothetical protein